MQRGFCVIHLFDERSDSAGVVKHVVFLRAGVGQGDGQAWIEEGEFSEALSEDVGAVLDGFEDGGVGFEGDVCAAFLGHACLAQRGVWGAAAVGLFKDVVVLPDFQFQPF